MSRFNPWRARSYRSCALIFRQVCLPRAELPPILRSAQDRFKGPLARKGRYSGRSARCSSRGRHAKCFGILTSQWSRSLQCWDTKSQRAFAVRSGSGPVRRQRASGEVETQIHEPLPPITFENSRWNIQKPKTFPEADIWCSNEACLENGCVHWAAVQFRAEQKIADYAPPSHEQPFRSNLAEIRCNLLAERWKSPGRRIFASWYLDQFR